MRLRDSSPVHVSTRSPIPERPAKVSGRRRAPTPTRMISASPRVMRAAIEFWAKPSPYDMPAAMAITFFSAPPISTECTSSEE